MTPQQIIARYKAILRQAYGEEIADKSEAYYRYGRYYINQAETFPDSSIGIIGPPKAYRHKGMLQLIAVLEEFLK